MTHPAHTSRGDRGAAVLEFVAMALVLTVPVAVALAAVVRIHVEQVTASSAAAAAALTLARDGGGPVRAQQLVRAHWDRPAAVTSAVDCATECGRPGSMITVTVTVEVPVPLWPGIVTVRQHNTQVVDRFAPR